MTNSSPARQRGRVDRLPSTAIITFVAATGLSEKQTLLPHRRRTKFGAGYFARTKNLGTLCLPQESSPHQTWCAVSFRCSEAMFLQHKIEIELMGRF